MNALFLENLVCKMIQLHSQVQKELKVTEEQAAKGEAPPQGGKRLYTEDTTFRFADGKAKLIPLPFIDNNERPDELFPFWLNSGRLVEHFHSRTRTGKIANNNKFSPTPFMEMNPGVMKIV